MDAAEAGRDLVPAGAARLADIESPDHRQWRQARELAAANLDQIRSAITRELAELARLLDADTPSAAWLAASKRIEHLTHAHSVATHVLHERPEPIDATTAQILVKNDGPNDWTFFTYKLNTHT